MRNTLCSIMNTTSPAPTHQKSGHVQKFVMISIVYLIDINTVCMLMSANCAPLVADFFVVLVLRECVLIY